MTFLLRIKKEDSVIGMQIITLYHAPFKVFIVMLHNVKHVLHKDAESRQAGKPLWLAFYYLEML